MTANVGMMDDMRRAGCALVALAVIGLGATGAGETRLAVTPASPAAGDTAIIAARGKLTAPVVVRLTTPRRTSTRLRLRRVNRTLWRGAYRFTFPGTWTLTLKRASRRVEVGPYPESTFVPLGVPGCAPPSPGNAITREARGSGTLWALLEGGRFGDPHGAVLDGVVGKDTKIVWRMTGQGDLALSAIGPNATTVAPTWVKAHDASNWKRPGDEWGSGFTFTQAGCWRLHAERADSSGDLWLVVRS
jgi:hypothetical protein